MTEDPKAKSLIQDFERMKTARSTYETAWADIRQLVRPNTVDFHSAQQSPGDVRTERIYDGTALQANVDLGNAVHTFIANPSERNFGIKPSIDGELAKDPDVIGWCDAVSDIIAAEYLDDRTMFTGSMQECFLDLAFGNIILNQEWNYDDGNLTFKAIPLATAFYEESATGAVDKLSRCMKMTVRQIMQQFPDATWEGKEKDEKTPDKEFSVIHAVYPRSDREYGRTDSGNMPFSSCWLLKEKCVILKEGGYHSFPYHVGRWSKSDEETYGRGPAINCLPEIRMLNRMELTIIKAWQKAVDPPLIMPSDGFLSKFKTAPASINFRDPSAGDFEVQTLRHEGKLEGVETKTDQKREYIRRCFYSDWVKLSPKKERQTAYEISELVDQQLRMMAPMLGRLQSEVMVPCIQRSYELLSKAQLLPPPPPQLQGRTIEVDYLSAASRAQQATRIVNYGKWIQNISPLASFKPDVFDAVDTDVIVQDMAVSLGVPAAAIRSSKMIAGIRDGRAQQEQAQQMAAAAEPLTKSVLNVAQANNIGNTL